MPHEPLPPVTSFTKASGDPSPVTSAVRTWVVITPSSAG